MKKEKTENTRWIIVKERKKESINGKKEKDVKREREREKIGK